MKSPSPFVLSPTNRYWRQSAKFQRRDRCSYFIQKNATRLLTLWNVALPVLRSHFISHFVPSWLICDSLYQPRKAFHWHSIQTIPSFLFELSVLLSPPMVIPFAMFARLVYSFDKDDFTDSALASMETRFNVLENSFVNGVFRREQSNSRWTRICVELEFGNYNWLNGGIYQLFRW